MLSSWLLMSVVMVVSGLRSTCAPFECRCNVCMHLSEEIGCDITLSGLCLSFQAVYVQSKCERSMVFQGSSLICWSHMCRFLLRYI